jgi:nucleolar complex protein 2
VKIHAFVKLRILFTSVNDFNQQILLKKVFKSFQEAAKHVVWRNYECIVLMVNCVTELFGLNMDQSYIVMYTSLKSLVDLLKKCSDNKVISSSILVER